MVEQLCPLSGGLNFAVLVVPDHRYQAPLADAPAFRARLRNWLSQGVEIFFHGWRHCDDSGRGGLKARHMTAGKGEFPVLYHGAATDARW